MCSSTGSAVNVKQFAIAAVSDSIADIDALINFLSNSFCRTKISALQV